MEAEGHTYHKRSLTTYRRKGSLYVPLTVAFIKRNLSISWISPALALRCAVELGNVTFIVVGNRQRMLAHNASTPSLWLNPEAKATVHNRKAWVFEYIHSLHGLAKNLCPLLDVFLVYLHNEQTGEKSAAPRSVTESINLSKSISVIASGRGALFIAISWTHRSYWDIQINWFLMIAKLIKY